MKQVRILILSSYLLFISGKLLAETIPDSQTINGLLQYIQQLSSEEKYEQAADILERILMLAPEAKGVALTYEQILQRIDSSHQAQAAPSEKSQWQAQALLGLKIGGGNNLNRAPNVSTIFTTLEQGSLLELSKEQRSQSGYGVETYGSVQTKNQLSDATQLNLQLHIANRTTNRENYTDYLDINGGIYLKHKLNNQDDIGLALYTDYISYDNASEFHALNLQSRYRWHSYQTCHQQIGMDIQWQHQANNSLFDALYTGLHGSLHCQVSSSAYSLEINAGNEWALQNRPGGDQSGGNLQLTHHLHAQWIINQAYFTSFVRYGYQHDQRGYSALLNNNAKRNLHLVSLGTKFRWPISQHYGHWFGIISLNWQQQYSDISLFEFNSLESWLGVEVSF